LYGDVDAAAFDDEPAIRAVDEIFNSAIAARASDIHIEPWSDGGRVRFRVDGALREARGISSRLLPRIVSRLKLLAGMDIADRRAPQDGRYTIERQGGAMDARVASIPTIAGEKLAVRLLDGGAGVRSLAELGMPDAVAARFRRAFEAASGFVVICGPTGSGKTTTLYSALAQLNVAAAHLCSIEDPVEIRLPGIAQMQVNLRAGLTFAAGLRAFVRQDPNAISIGELRDAETAAVAASAALCGQLILTTLHSTNALGAVERLAELGIAPRRIAAGVTAIVSQRLLRQLCANCKRPAGETYEVVGCQRCEGSGYRGRSGVFEILGMTPALRAAIAERKPFEELQFIAAEAGYEPMQMAAARLTARGVTSEHEARRVLAEELA
jgi:type II secretory ATPase GspE/PulE/Tfp pilus assembly ATPase PilB-like protein